MIEVMMFFQRFVDAHASFTYHDNIVCLSYLHQFTATSILAVAISKDAVFAVGYTSSISFLQRERIHVVVILTVS